MAAPLGARDEGPATQLHEFLTAALGDERRATLMLKGALDASGHPSVPRAPHQALAWARLHVIPRVGDVVGVSLAAALLNDLAVALGADAEEASTYALGRIAVTSEPVSCARPVAARRARGALLLVDADRLQRPNLARAFVRAGYDVTVADGIGDVCCSLGEGVAFELAVVDLDHPEAEQLLDTLIDNEIPLLARAACIEKGLVLLKVLGAGTYAVRSKDARPEDLVELSRRGL